MPKYTKEFKLVTEYLSSQSGGLENILIGPYFHNSKFSLNTAYM